MVLTFTVQGTPAPQGSKTIARSRHGTWLRDDNRSLAPWRSTVAAAALACMIGRRPLAGPLRLEATFVFPRPKSHYRSGALAGQLRPSAPFYCDTRPDLDKLLRAIGDAVTGIAIVADANIVEIDACKLYGLPRADITIRELQRAEDT